jgi:DNA-binding CsgD family transcriptional regulator
VRDAPGEKWSAIQDALLRGGRGLPGGDTLLRLLARERAAARPRKRRPKSVALARRQQAVLLSGQGLSRKEIGVRLGVTPQAVGHMLRRARREG